MSFDDLQFSFLSGAPVARPTLCPRCGSRRMLDGEECPSCGGKVIVLPSLPEVKLPVGGAAAAAAGAGSGGAGAGGAAGGVAGAGAAGGGAAGGGAAGGVLGLEALLQSLLMAPAAAFGQSQLISPDDGLLQLLNAQRGMDMDAIIERLMQEGPPARPASKEFVADLAPQPLRLSERYQLCVCVVSGDKKTPLHKPFFATEAEFGTSLLELRLSQEGVEGPSQHVVGPLVLASPLSGSGEVKNRKEFKEKIVIMSRGEISFVDKAKKAQEGGALALLVLQTESVWPYTMADQAKKGGDIKIPALMLSQADAKVLQKLMTESVGAIVSLTTTPLSPSCPICQDEIDIKVKPVRLPCYHIFHKDCIVQWLEKCSTCPLCRHQLPTDAPVPRSRPDEDRTLAHMIS